VTELGTFLLPVVPLLVLLAFLLLGRYPGCDAIVRLSERIAARARPRSEAARRPRRPRAPRSFAPGGGLLIALGLAQRPPPLPA
jgi:hypothetical protein